MFRIVVMGPQARNEDKSLSSEELARRAKTTDTKAVMRCVALIVVVGLIVAGNSGTISPHPSDEFDKSVRPLLAKYCLSCHGPNKQSGDLALHDKSLPGHVAIWESVVEKLEKNEMPPKGKPQPSVEERRVAIQSLKFNLSKIPRETQAAPRVVLRRLNRAEYNNTIRDLLALDFRPADDFPADDVGYGFDNIGDVLSLSPLLLEKHLTAAETIVQRAFTGELPPLPPKREYRPREYTASGKAAPGPDRSLVFSEGEVSFTHSFPRDGDYVFVYRALGKQIDKEAIKLLIKFDGAEHLRADLKPFADKRDLPDREVTLKVKEGTRTVAFAIANPKSNADEPDPKKRDRAIVIGATEIRGPLVPLDKIMPEAYRRIMIALPGPRHTKVEAARLIVTNFARRAFRRPVKDWEIERYVALVESAERNGDSFERGVQLAIQAILVSPHFLFKVEGENRTATSPFPITDHELATRLSYFLWSSCPDDELARLADRGEMRGQLQPIVRRMLKDPKSRALADNFAGQWLQIRNLTTMTPDPKHFPQFDETLRSAMMQETTLFFDAMVREDRRVLNFLDADFTFANERLARHYGISGVKGAQFRRVSLAGTGRAGITTHASILTVTSNVTRTSPVKRGKFVLENLLNADVPPPPPDVPELAENAEAVAGAPLRKRMEVHRTNPDCAVCHQKMDPLGFAFENFDAIGAWRTKDGSFAIDSSGEMPDGRAFQDHTDLRRLLRDQPDAFRRCLAEKLLTYALGRGIERADRPAIDKICEQAKQQDDKLSALFLAIVASEPFQTKAPAKR